MRRTDKEKSKKTKWIIILIGLLAVPLLLGAGTLFYIFYVLSVMSHSEPYNETNPALIIDKIENNFDISFSTRMNSLQAADKIAGGIDRPYIFIVRFTTDKTGFANLRELLSGLGNWEETTNELLKKDYNTDEYDPRYIVLYKKDTPDWYKMRIAKGRTYESFLVSKNNKMRLITICVEVAESSEIVVYMEGWGDTLLGM